MVVSYFLLQNNNSNFHYGMYIHVRVTANSREEKFEKKSDTQFVVSVREKAEKNMANKRIIDIFRGIFNTGKVRIVNGHRSSSKLLSVDVD